MSDSQAYEAMAVSVDGVTVTKQFEADEFPVPAIAFEFESDRSEPVTVHLTDAVPEEVEVEDLGFHPEYGSEYWTIEDDEISFERAIDPNSTYTTVYGIRATGTDNVDQFLTEPTITSVDPPLDDEEALVGRGTDAVKDVISGEADSVPGLDDVDDEDIDTLDLKDPQGNRIDAEDAGDASGDAGNGAVDAAGGGDDESAPARPVDQSLVAAMAAELRNQNVTKEDVKLLRKAFDLASDDERGSVDARIQKLQRDVTDVIAYTDALEEFLDENGTGEEILDEFRTEVESFRERVAAFDDELDDLGESVSGHDDEIDALSDDVETVESEMADVETQVADVESRLEDLRDELEAVRDEVGDGDVDERIDDVQAEIRELKQWREQLSSVIGGAD